MKRSLKKKTITLTLILTLLLTLCAPALAATVEELEAQKTQSQNTITAENYKVNQSQTTIDGIEKEIVNANAQVDTLKTAVGTIDSEMAVLNTQISQTQEKLDKAVSEETEQQKALDERVRVLYMYGPEGFLQAFFEGDTLTERVSSADIVSKIIKSDQELLENLKNTRQSIEQNKKTLDDQKTSLSAAKADKESKLAAVQSIVSQKEQLINSNQTLISQAKQQIAQEEASIAAANQTIKDISAKAEADMIAKKRADAEKKAKQAAAAKETAQKLAQQAQVSADNSDDQDVSALADEIKAASDKTVTAADKAVGNASDTAKADTAVKAAESNKQLDTNLSDALAGAADAQDKASQIAQKQVDAAKKKAEAAAAAKDAEAQKATAAQKKAEDDAAAAAAAAKAAQEEAQKQAQAAQDTRSSWDKNEVSTTGWKWPLAGIFDITSLFGYRIHPIFGTGSGHQGLDIGASTGTPILSCDNGTVIFAGENGGYGNCVIVQQNSGHQVYYAHQSEIAVSQGQSVTTGQTLGYVGSTGWSTGPHLHLGVLAGDEFVDPLNFFPEVANMQ